MDILRNFYIKIVQQHIFLDSYFYIDTKTIVLYYRSNYILYKGIYILKEEKAQICVRQEYLLLHDYPFPLLWAYPANQNQIFIFTIFLSNNRIFLPLLFSFSCLSWLWIILNLKINGIFCSSNVPEYSTLLRVLASSISSLKRKETWIICWWLWEAVFASKGIFTLHILIQQKGIQIMQAIKSSSKHTWFGSCDFAIV